ncbi:MAG: Rpn family recombination-promoting nuclease/putative transposase [Gammaproteobacteria bacterium]|nr:Rpn family recombination-promoting nuclease/putative transposase [Gammaproteobacteria bacterium]
MWPAIMGAMEHDALSKLFFALPPVQADVLRIVAGDWVHVLDLDSLERVSAEHAAPDLIQRTGDLAWRVRFRKGALAEGEPPWLLVPMEFQSSVDLEMGARVREYVERHLGALRREGAWSWEGEEPLVLPVVVHDGQTRWRRGDGLLHGLPEAAARALAPMQPGRYELLDASAGALEDWPADNRVTAWVRLLRSTAASELRAALGAGLSAFPEPGDVGFREVLRLWSLALLRANKAWSGEELAEIEDSQGENEMASLVEVNGRKIQQEWFEEGRMEGVAQGMERGLQRGRSEERVRLRRKLARELDPETAARVSKLLDPGE